MKQIKQHITVPPVYKLPHYTTYYFPNGKRRIIGQRHAITADS